MTFNESIRAVQKISETPVFDHSNYRLFEKIPAVPGTLNNQGFTVVNFPFLDGDVPPSLFYGVNISQLIHFARVCSNVDDFNNRNKFLISKLFKQGYRYHKFCKAFSKFYYRHSE